MRSLRLDFDQVDRPRNTKIANILNRWMSTRANVTTPDRTLAIPLSSKSLDSPGSTAPQHFRNTYRQVPSSFTVSTSEWTVVVYAATMKENTSYPKANRGLGLKLCGLVEAWQAPTPSGAT
jgi:hypothetical protein